VIFGPYFLVPLGLAGLILLLEAGIISKNSRVILAALIAPAFLIFLSVAGQRSDVIYRRFLTLFTERLGGDPLYLTLVALVGYYAYAMARRVPLASEGLTAILAALAVVNPEFLDRGKLFALHTEPLLAIAFLQLGLGLRRQCAWRCALGAAALVAGWVLAFGEWTPIAAVITCHLLLLAMLAVGAMFDEAFARALRVGGAGLGLLACLATLFLLPEDFLNFPRWAMEVYPEAMALFLVGYGLLLACRPVLAMGGIAVVGWLAAMGFRGYASARQFVLGLDYLVASLTLFALALLISLGKSGILPRWIAGRWRKVPHSTE
jgi:hypothetical protein